MRTVMVAILLASLLTVVAGCSKGNVTELGVEDNAEAAIELRRGSVHTVSLEGNPSTGYQWQAEFDEQVLELRSEDFKAKSGLVGAPGLQLFEFRALKTGTTTISFRYIRPWESVAIKTATVTITVK